jgi:AcrR family transcriptional regulator
MVVYVGQGDPQASMRLLWDRPGQSSPSARSAPRRAARPGPKPVLDLETVIRAAIQIADEGGLDAITMRGVGKRLGCTPMALYTYVPGKAELIELMWDRVLAELPAAYDRTSGWRPALRQWAVDTWECYLRHPWTLHISGARASLGPNETHWSEAAAQALGDTALAARDTVRIIWTLARFVHGCARTMAETRSATTETGVDEVSWWEGRSAMLEEVAPDYGQRFPALTKLSAEGAFDPLNHDTSYLEAEAQDIFEFGLEILLDGFTLLIEPLG